MRRICLLLALGLALLPTVPALAQPSETAVKAAFLPKFARYVQWPAGTHPAPSEPFQLCVIGHDPFGQMLDRAAASEIVDGRAVVVRRVASTDDASGCHLGFVRGSNGSETGRMLLALRGQPTLTITDSRNGPQRGMIHFTVAAGRVRFFIDEAQAHTHGLSISSRLLALALGVRQRRS